MSMAMPKLIKVSIRIYSVSLRSLEADNSPNLNTDLAVIKKPTASQWPATRKIKTKRRSKMPIYFPASFNDLLFLVSLEIFHLEKIILINIEAGIVKKAKQIINKRLLAFIANVKLKLSWDRSVTNRTIVIRCNN